MTELGITAVLTTYQRPERAKRALRSILGQSVVPDEIVVVEDGSASDLPTWIDELHGTEINYVRHESNRGLAAARNTGAKLARGYFVAYLDDDDEWLPRRLEAQLDHFSSMSAERRDQLGALQVGCVVVDPSGAPISVNLPVNQGKLRDSIIEKGASTPSSSFLFVRSALDRVGGFDEELISGVDHDVWMKLAVAGYFNEVVPEPLVRVVRDYSRSMMADTERRIAGIDQFVEKWRPTYHEWFGQQAGDEYAAVYFVRAISKLAAQKLATNQGQDGWLATRAILQRARGRPGLWIWGVFRIARGYLYHRLPALRGIRRRARALLRSLNRRVDVSDG